MPLTRLFKQLMLTAVFFTVLAGFFASLAGAAPVPRDLTLGRSESNSKLLGGVCYTTDTGHQALPCNPAFISREVDPDFRAYFFAGNNISYLRDVSDLLAGDGNEDTVDRLFSQSRPAEMEANIEGAYRQPTFGVSFSPYRVLYFTAIRNKALPVVTLLASREQTLRFQFGSYIENDWSWGVQLRGVRREYIGQTFSIADIAVEKGTDVLEPRQQSAFYVEPGLLKEWPESAWRPQMTFAITQLGFVDRKTDYFPASPALHVGGAVQPDLGGWGNWEFGVNADLHSQTQTWSDPFRFGTSYRLGVTRFSGSVGRSDHALGFQVNYKDFFGGLNYTSRWIKNWFGSDEWVRTVFFEFGFDL